MIKFIIGLIVGLGLAYLGYRYLPEVKEVIQSRTEVLQDYLRIAPVRKLATYEVHTRVSLYDDYNRDYRIGGFDTPHELDRLWSQITASGWADIIAVYGYPSAVIGSGDVTQWGDPQLLYYEVSDNNIDQVVTGLGVTNEQSVQRIVNQVLNKLHSQLKDQFAHDNYHINQAKYHAWCTFASTGCNLITQ